MHTLGKPVACFKNRSDGSEEVMENSRCITCMSFDMSVNSLQHRDNHEGKGVWSAKMLHRTDYKNGKHCKHRLACRLNTLKSTKSKPWQPYLSSAKNHSIMQGTGM